MTCLAEGACGGITPTPWHRDSCVFSLQTTDGDLQATEISRVKLPAETLLQHSHSLCLTENWLVVKLDRFYLHKSDAPDPHGMLGEMQQEEKNLWLRMNRKTNESVVMEGDFSFINNHFWNCYETEDGSAVMVESVTATHDYLDQYFVSELSLPTNWTKLFHSPKRCIVSTVNESTIECSDFVSPGLIFDYPTFNPLFKTKPYQFFYAISPVTYNSRWFDSIIKIEHLSGSIVASYKCDGCYFTEADFIPGLNGATDEDDGLLSSIVYNATSDKSFALLLDAKTLLVKDSTPLPFVVPFHAHGIVKTQNRIYSNP
jgi:carotenoid cleavage dioxygenase-like enzyme